MSDTPTNAPPGGHTGPPPFPPRPSQSPQTGRTGHEPDKVPDSEPNTQGGTGGGEDVALRHITFWRNGFSLKDGPLIRYDQPGSTQLLHEINAGRAPPQFLNVRVGQLVELRVYSRVDEDYVPPSAPSPAAVEHQGRRPVPLAPSTNTFLRQ